MSAQWLLPLMFITSVSGYRWCITGCNMLHLRVCQAVLPILCLYSVSHSPFFCSVSSANSRCMALIKLFLFTLSVRSQWQTSCSPFSPHAECASTLGPQSLWQIRTSFQFSSRNFLPSLRETLWMLRSDFRTSIPSWKNSKNFLGNSPVLHHQTIPCLTDSSRFRGCSDPNPRTYLVQPTRSGRLSALN